MMFHLHSHGWTRRRIHRLFTGELAAMKRHRLFDELDQCDACASHYRYYHRMETALCRPADGLSPFAVQRARAAVLELRHNSKKPRLLSIRRLALAGSLSGLTLALIWLLIGPTAPDPDRVNLSPASTLAPVAVVARGDGASQNSRIGIRVFRVSTRRDDTAETDRLTIKDIVTFTYSQVDDSPGYLTIFGIQSTGDIRWYHPPYSGRESILVNGGKVDEPLGDGFQLEVNHRPGWLRIVSLFSQQPIDTDTIEAVVRHWSAGTSQIREMVPLPLADLPPQTLEHSILVQIADIPDMME